MADAVRVLAVFAPIGANAFFVAAEYAVVTARRSALAQRRDRRAAAALRLMDDPVGVISTVQVGITALGIANRRRRRAARRRTPRRRDSDVHQLLLQAQPRATIGARPCRKGARHGVHRTPTDPPAHRAAAGNGACASALPRDAPPARRPRMDQTPRKMGTGTHSAARPDAPAWRLRDGGCASRSPGRHRGRGPIGGLHALAPGRTRSRGHRPARAPRMSRRTAHASPIRAGRRTGEGPAGRGRSSST
jgi:hypothetical protein